MLPKDHNEIAEHWGDLQPEIRAAIIAQAKDRIWWEGLKKRIRNLGPWFSWLTVVITAAILLRDQIVHLAAWIAGIGGGKP